MRDHLNRNEHCTMNDDKRIGLYLACEGLGDSLYCIPSIKRLVELSAPGTLYDVITYHPNLFRGCPYVNQVFLKTDDIIKQYKYKIQQVFDPKVLPFQLMETMDFISIPLGIGQLSFRQKQLEYFPVEEDEAGYYDIVLNTSMTWPSRSWPLENWQACANKFLDRGNSVAVVGKDFYSQAEKAWKRSTGLEGCTDLTNRLSLDQTYFTIHKCGLFITCQNGLSVLSGTTNTEIIVLDQPIEWSKRAIYRNEDPHYKVTYVKGNCDRYCCVSFDCPLENEAEKMKCIPDLECVLSVAMEKAPAKSRC